MESRRVCWERCVRGTGDFQRQKGVKKGHLRQVEANVSHKQTEGKTIEDCREMLRDALDEMMSAYRQHSMEVPIGNALMEQIAVEL